MRTDILQQLKEHTSLSLEHMYTSLLRNEELLTIVQYIQCSEKKDPSISLYLHQLYTDANNLWKAAKLLNDNKQDYDNCMRI